MTTQQTAVDFDFRPDSYFFPASFADRLLARIQGAERRKHARRMIETGRIDELPELLAKAVLSPEERHVLGRIHPSLMGGEYLPDMRPGEVEIARIAIASMTGDVTSIYARPGKNCIRYRAVDEYQDDTLARPCHRWSRRPLTLGQLAKFFDSTWSIYEVLELNEFGNSEYSMEQVHEFIVSVESEFYPQFGPLYTQRITEWKARHMRDLACDEDEDEDCAIDVPSPAPG